MEFDKSTFRSQVMIQFIGKIVLYTTSCLPRANSRMVYLLGANDRFDNSTAERYEAKL